MTSNKQRAQTAWAAGSLFAWLLLALVLAFRFSGGSLTHLKAAWGYLLVAAIHGLIAHILLFVYTKPGTPAKGFQTGVLIAFVALIVYAFPCLFLIGWVAAGLGLKPIAAVCSFQLVLILGGMPFFLLLSLLGGALAGFARWRSLAKDAKI
jgi:hypothetical protein